MANFLAMSVALNPGDEVLIEQPGYGLFSDVANYIQAQAQFFVRSLTNGFEVNTSDLAAKLTPQTRLIVLSNLHNPSGALMLGETLRDIGKLALDRGIYVFIDEVYLEMLFDGAAPFAFAIGQELGGDRNPFITTNSLTKTFGLSGLRCGWILAEPELARQMWRLNDLFGVNAAHVAEQMSVVAFDRLTELRNKARALLSANRRLLDDFLDAHGDLECFRPPAGTVVFPKLPHGNLQTFFDLLREKYETTVVPGRFFGSPQHFRIGIGGETDVVRGGLERLSAALRESFSW